MKNYLKIEVLKARFEDRNFEKLFENGNLKIKFKKGNFEELFESRIFWKLDLKEIGVSKIYLEMEFKKN